MRGNCGWAGDGLSRADRCADRDGAQQERTCEGSERASELRLTKHFNLPFAGPLVSVRADASYYSNAVPIPENCEKLQYS